MTSCLKKCMDDYPINALPWTLYNTNPISIENIRQLLKQVAEVNHYHDDIELQKKYQIIDIIFNVNILFDKTTNATIILDTKSKHLRAIFYMKSSYESIIEFIYHNNLAVKIDHPKSLLEIKELKENILPIRLYTKKEDLEILNRYNKIINNVI